MRHFLAFDLGASSGRAMLGAIGDGRLTLEELHRFPNEPVRLLHGLYWDTLRLWHEMLAGASVAGRARGLHLDGIGVDCWGVDFGLLGADGALVDNPRHYRDARTAGMTGELCRAVPREEIFELTGIQFMDINSLVQLYAMKRCAAPALRVAEKLLFIPDIFNYWLTGVARAERTIASTSQFYNPRTGNWAVELLAKLGLPIGILPPIVDPGERLGTLLPYVGEATGLAPGTPVYATGCHDTASAVAAVPATGGSWCYISSGTWSLMGVEADQPLVTPEVLAANLTNEVGAGGKIRLLKNIAGMWLIEECRRAWALAGENYSYADLTAMAESARPFRAVIHPDRFSEPGRMPERIAAFCHDTGQAAPDGPGEMERSILESLALRYRQVLEDLDRLLGGRIATIHIVGGGSKNGLLNQFVADCTGRTVVAGPTEATAAGNVLIQAIGSGLLSGLEEARALVRASFPVETYEPRPVPGWDAAYEKFLSLG